MKALNAGSDPEGAGRRPLAPPEGVQRANEERRRNEASEPMSPLLPASLTLLAVLCAAQEDTSEWWEMLRRDRVAAGVCPDSDADLCGGPNHDKSLMPSMCRCDSDCKFYGDCCADREPRIPDHIPWVCLYHGGREFYGQSECPIEFDGDEDVIRHCHRQGTQLRPIQDMPVYSVATRTMYANVFCAVCNGDADALRPWTVRLDCNRAWDAARVLALLARSSYSARSRTMYGPRSSGLSCHLHIEDTRSESFFQELHGVRECRQAFSSCRPEADRRDVHLCARYTAMVYSPRQMANYRNFHCFRCSGGSSSRAGALECGARAAGSGNDLPESSHVVLSVESNFRNIDRCKGPSAIYDPITHRCFEELAAKPRLRSSTSACGAVETISVAGELVVAVLAAVTGFLPLWGYL